MENKKKRIINRNLESYAKGWLEGSTEDKSALTAANIAAAVWNAIASSFLEEGTMGKAMASAGSAGDPWSGIMAGYTDDATFGAFVKKLLTEIKFEEKVEELLTEDNFLALKD